MADFDDRSTQLTVKPAEQDRISQLYEGNYDEWLPQAELKLILNGFWSLSLNSEQSRPHPGYGALLLKMNVRYELLARIPYGDQLDPVTFLAALKKVAQPFRFADLPPELRAKILGYAVRSKDDIVLISTPDEDSVEDTSAVTVLSEDNFQSSGPLHSEMIRCTRPPHVTRASHMLRAEALPLYYRLNDFRMYLNHRDEIDFLCERLHEVYRWAKLNEDWLVNLQSLTVSVKDLPIDNTSTTKRVCGIRATYSPKKGLKLVDPKDCVSLLKPLYQRRAEIISSRCSTYGMHGKVLPMLFSRAFLYPDMGNFSLI